jgi:hypothetical protein
MAGPTLRLLDALTAEERKRLRAGVVEVSGEAKNRVGLGIVAAVLKLYPGITFDELKVMLPDALNPRSTNRTTNLFDPYTERPYGVVQPGSIRQELAAANQRKKEETGKDDHYKMVHWTGDEETFRTADGVEVLVATGFEGDSLQRVIDHVAQYGVRVVEFAPYRGGGKKGFYALKVLDPVLAEKLQGKGAAAKPWLRWLIGGALVLIALVVWLLSRDN